MVQLVSDRITAAMNLPGLMPVRTDSLLLTTALIALSYYETRHDSPPQFRYRNAPAIDVTAGAQIS